MRYLVVPRGLPGAGKSTWIQMNGFAPYTISPDAIRLLYSSPVFTEDGRMVTSMANDKAVWKLVMELIERRMQQGDLIVVDATHTQARDINQYRQLADEYRYRVVVVDFSHVTAEEAKIRNQHRVAYKIVPDAVIDKMAARLADPNNKPAGFAKFITPVAALDLLKYDPIDFSEYKKVHMFGDIQGCYAPLKEYFDREGGIKDDELYIFVGDYLDRGTQNAEVFRFMFSLFDRKNVILLEGNHEIHLWKWGNDDPVKSAEFRNYTQPELIRAGITKKQARVFYRALRQVVYFKYNGWELLVNHGGIPAMPTNLLRVPTRQFVHGVGAYEVEIDRIWHENNEKNGTGVIQVHGHRNIQKLPVHPYMTSINLEGQVDFGGHLRVVTIDRHGFLSHEVKNDLVRDRFAKEIEMFPENLTLLEELRSDSSILEKKFGNISSFVFKNNVFYDRTWNERNVKARGLFINTKTGEIVSRSYNKFFNVGELPETSPEELAKKMAWPARAYFKENGFLGIVGYDSEMDVLVPSSKSSLQGDFQEMFAEMFNTIVPYDRQQRLKDTLRDQQIALVFEVCHPKKDPHMIEYPEPTIILLDAVKRTEKYEKWDYETLKAFQNVHLPMVGLKEYTHLLSDGEEFLEFFNREMSSWDSSTEGYVIEDANGFMTKVKLPFYSFWKQMRGIKDNILLKGREIDYDRLDARGKAFVEWAKDLSEKELQKDIITLRKKFVEIYPEWE